MNIDEELKKILDNDDLGLFNITPKRNPNIKDAEQRLLDSFEKINDFVNVNGNVPSTSSRDLKEKQLSYRLQGIRNDKEKTILLSPYDIFNLLSELPPKEYNTIEDVLADDDLGLLNNNDTANSIFDLKHVKEINTPDYIATRTRCKNFNEYEQLFKDCQYDLSKERRHLLPFKNESQIHQGDFFVLKGILLYIAEMEDFYIGSNGKTNARTRCIFENGTESDMLWRSLGAGLYKDGRRVSVSTERLLDDLKNINDDDQETGYIYILKSLSKDIRIQSIENLYKIGYSQEAVEDRIKNAEKEPTYLMAKVEIIDCFRCFNINPQKLEQLLHNFFGNSCLNIDIFDENNQRHSPREWFIAPYQVIYQAIHFILNGEIVNYKYDNIKQEIVNK